MLENNHSSSESSPKSLVVIGGGAAGFFCAVNAARLAPDLHVSILEKTNKLLSKVKVSGGGRCNVTHACFDILEISKRYPRGEKFVKKAFHQFFTTNTVQWFESRGVKLKEEQDGRIFPVSDSSQSVIDCLMNEAAMYGVDVRTGCEVRQIEVDDSHFAIKLVNGEMVSASHVVIATGGFPKRSMFDWLKVLGHSIADPVPSLFTFNLPKQPITALQGVSAPARLKIEGSKLAQEGSVLITHWGLSGPAVLRLSAWGARELADRNYHFQVHINWLPPHNEQSIKDDFDTLRREHGSKKIWGHNFGHLPKRLWEFLLTASGVKPEIRFADLPAKTENLLIKNLADYIVSVSGKTTFKEEFVTAGGVTLSEVDANKMMSKKVPNLYFAGEVLDVDGITGGFNFQHAWTSGWIAAKDIANQVSKI